jgi:hypothetical protein
LQDHHEPHDVSPETEGGHDGDAGISLGHAGGEDKVHGVDHEAEDLLKEGPDRKGDDLSSEGELSEATGEAAIGFLKA